MISIIGMILPKKYCKYLQMKFLVTGAGGFIGGQLVSSLIKDGHDLICADIKPLKYWFQTFKNAKNSVVDLKDYDSCLKVTKDVDYIYNMACNMGGMGFIENNKSECMLSVLINTNLLRASIENKCKKYLFSSSACVYNSSKQNQNFITDLKEEDAYPASPEDGYGWEKLFSERMCRHFMEDFSLETRVIRYHNVYGPVGTYDGGREKVPAALCRKIALAKINKKKSIEIWGDGEQTRSFMYIDDCIYGTKKIFNSNFNQPINLGTNFQVSINQLCKIIEEIAQYEVKKEYLMDKPLGVRGRSSDNTLIKKVFNWEPNTKLADGLKITYDWIYNQILNNGDEKFRKA
jgi:GDP-D-mannose 3', 5'-epimerase